MKLTSRTVAIVLPIVCCALTGAAISGAQTNPPAGDLERALTDYNHAIEQNPKDPRAYVDRGNIKSDKGDKEGAMADYNRAIELDPGSASAYFKRSMIEFGNGAIDKGIADYHRAVELDPKYRPPAYNPKDSFDFGTKIEAWLANRASSHDEPKSQVQGSRHWVNCFCCGGSGKRPQRWGTGCFQEAIAKIGWAAMR